MSLIKKNEKAKKKEQNFSSPIFNWSCESNKKKNEVFQEFSFLKEIDCERKSKKKFFFFSTSSRCSAPNPASHFKNAHNSIQMDIGNVYIYHMRVYAYSRYDVHPKFLIMIICTISNSRSLQGRVKGNFSKKLTARFSRILPKKNVSFPPFPSLIGAKRRCLREEKNLRRRRARILLLGCRCTCAQEKVNMYICITRTHRHRTKSKQGERRR